MLASPSKPGSQVQVRPLASPGAGAGSSAHVAFAPQAKSAQASMSTQLAPAVANPVLHAVHVASLEPVQVTASQSATGGQDAHVAPSSNAPVGQLHE